MTTLNKKKKLIVAYYFYKKHEDEKKKSAVVTSTSVRRYWVHPILLRREEFGEFHTLYDDLRKDEKEFSDYFRMNIKTFDKLLSILYDKLKHQDSIMRECITPTERLAVTIRYLATGHTYADLRFAFRIGKSTLHLIIQEVCYYIWEELSKIYMRIPSENDWLDIAQDFARSANFPHCLGAVDGKHIRVIKPIKSGSMFLNYKHFFSIVLMAIVDSNYNFIFIDVGAYGKECDSNVFKQTIFWQNLLNNTLNLPTPARLTETGESLPYVFVGDEAFALHNNLLRPFSGQQLEAKKSVFNYRLTRARRYVECAFGIMANKWRILHRPLNVSINLSISIVKTCCLLQNFIHKEEGLGKEVIIDIGSELQSIPLSDHVHRNLNANIIRQHFADFFMSEQGRVSWQSQYS